MVDYATLPPETNSARMYFGPGSAPMLAAASAWNGLAAELRTAALSYGSVLTALTSDDWRGPASESMAAATAPSLAWLSTTASQAEHTAAQAEAAATAYEAALAATVPPLLIADNRVQLATLITSNVLGQNTPAIAATEAQYAEMWAQDATAMYGYANASALASQLRSFTQPQDSATSNGLSSQSAAGAQQSTLAQLISSIPSALQGLANPAASGSGLGGILDDLGLGILSPSSGQSGSGLSGLLNLLSGTDGSALGKFLNANVLNTIFSSGFYMPGNFMGTAADFMWLSGQASEAAGNAASGAAEVVAPPLMGIEGAASGVSAALGRSPIVGALSVPPSWTVPEPLHSPLSSTLGGTPMVAPAPAVVAGMPGVPLGGNMSQPLGRAVPQYGFRPTFVARPPAAG
jgi:PPE-repeat protein